MRKNKAIKAVAAVLSAAFTLSGITVFAQSSDTTQTTETVIEDNRTLTPKGNAELVDNVSDSENLQFITVTARDGNVFYFVIDKGAESENVYFLNTVDESDLEALIEETDKTKSETAVTPEPTETDLTTEKEQETETPEKSEQTQKETSGNNGFLLVMLLLIGAAGVGVYYFKVVLPKKKLEAADDIEDFEFEEYDEDEETEIEDSEDETEE